MCPLPCAVETRIYVYIRVYLYIRVLMYLNVSSPDGTVVHLLGSLISGSDS